MFAPAASDLDAQLAASARDPEMVRAAQALAANDIPVAEAALRARLKAHPTEVAAIRMLAEVAGRIGRYGDAEKLLHRALDLTPGFDAARQNLAFILHRQGRADEALAQLDIVAHHHPAGLGHRTLRAAILVRRGEYEAAIALYEHILAAQPNQPQALMSLGHALKTVGRQAESIAAYRRAIALDPALGEAWWSLANLKTVRFDAADIVVMNASLQRPDLPDEARLHLDFALGKALEDARDYAASFRHYARANALRRSQIAYDPAETSADVNAMRALYTPELFAARAGQGCTAPDPIFIVGLPRSGSTLIEQILASHSAVEGTSELSDLLAIARTLGARAGAEATPDFAANMRAADPARLAALGQDYLDRTRVQRKSDRPLFIDKMPNNFVHTGLIALILPNAKIIDARRHPLGCCLSGFKQHFARGQAFTYDLAEVGAYWRDYAMLMAHFDDVLPGRVHRVIYETMVADPETEIWRLLAYCGLDFEPACLDFHKTERPVRTASSEQVRQPLYASGVDHWQHYAEWLGPMRAALGSALDSYPEVPQHW